MSPKISELASKMAELSSKTTMALNNKAASDLTNVTQADVRSKAGTGTMAYRNVTISTSPPSGGADGDVWLQY